MYVEQRIELSGTYAHVYMGMYSRQSTCQSMSLAFWVRTACILGHPPSLRFKAYGSHRDRILFLRTGGYMELSWMRGYFIACTLRSHVPAGAHSMGALAAVWHEETV